MNKEVLQETITKVQETINKSKEEWSKTYEEQANTLTNNKTLLDQFHKKIKEYEKIQFYITEVKATLPITIQARYQGQPIAAISVAEDNTTISTVTYDESNKKIYNCDMQLKDQKFSTVETLKFLNFFSKDMKPKAKIDENLHTQAMLLNEFAKTSSTDKLLLGCQPVKYSNLYYQIPITLNTGIKIDDIKILTRTKVRKLSILETLREDQTPEKVLANATAKAVFLCNLLKTQQGQEWYRIMGFHGRVPNPKVKVCIAVPKNLKAKCQKFEPFEIGAEAGNIEYHYMTYDTNGTTITSINTTLNE